MMSDERLTGEYIVIPTETLDELNGKIERLQAERDAAVADISVGDCDTCKFKMAPFDVMPCIDCCVLNSVTSSESRWQWRGLEVGK